MNNTLHTQTRQVNIGVTCARNIKLPIIDSELTLCVNIDVA